MFWHLTVSMLSSKVGLGDDNGRAMRILVLTLGRLTDSLAFCHVLEVPSFVSTGVE